MIERPQKYCTAIEKHWAAPIDPFGEGKYLAGLQRVIPRDHLAESAG
jgi:hypothetical protein